MAAGEQRLLTQIALLEEERKKAVLEGDRESAALASQRKQLLDAQLTSIRAQGQAVDNVISALSKELDDRKQVLTLAQQFTQIETAKASQQSKLNDLVEQEAQLRERAAQASTQAFINQSRALLAPRQGAQNREQDRARKAAQELEQTRIRAAGLSSQEEARRLQSARARFAIENRGAELARQRAELLRGLEQQRERLLQRQGDLAAQGLSSAVELAQGAEALSLIDKRVEAAKALNQEQDKVTQDLERQSRLEAQILRTSQDRAETARLESQLTETTRGNTGGAFGSATGELINTTGGQQVGIKGATRLKGSREEIEVPGDTAVFQAEFLGNTIGITIAEIINKSVVSALILGQDDKGRVINSFSSLFKSIADAANDTFKRLKTPAGILSLLTAGGGDFGGAGTDPGGQVVRPGDGPIRSGFAAGGRIPRANSPASAAHFFAGGLASGGKPLRPAGLHPTDTVPIWAAPGEFMQPVSAVQKYGPQVMEAIRRGAIDPMSLRALAGAGRSVRRPRTGGFQTGGEVLQTASPSEGGQGVSRAVIVSSEDQLDNLMAGSGEAFLRFAANNREDVRSALGL